MSSLKPSCWILSWGLLLVPSLALAQASDEASDRSQRRLSHAIYLGAGGAWSSRPDLDRFHPGGLVGADWILGGRFGIGVSADMTYLDYDSPIGWRRRLLTGVELKFLPRDRGVVRPYGMVGLAMSSLEEGGYGYSFGGGVFLVTHAPVAFFADLRRYQMENMEANSYGQVSLRGGVMF